MEALLIITGVLSIVAYIIFGADKRRRVYGKPGLSGALLIPTVVIAPFGSLMGMLLFGSRLRRPLYIILAPLCLAAYCLGVYLLRGSIWVV